MRGVLVFSPHLQNSLYLVVLLLGMSPGLINLYSYWCVCVLGLAFRKKIL